DRVPAAPGTVAAPGAAAVTRVEDAAEIMVTETASGAFGTILILPGSPGTAAILLRLSIVIATATETATETATVIVIDIIAVIEIALMIAIGDIAKRVFTRPRITATIEMAQMPTTRAITMACTRERMMPGTGRAMIRSARIFIDTAPAGSYLSLEARRHIAKPIAMVSCAVITKGFKTIRIILSADVFIDSCYRCSWYPLVTASGSVSVM